MQRLRQIDEPSADDEQLLDIVTDFLHDELDGDTFVQAWETLAAEPSSSADAGPKNYQALLQRLQRGDVVLFLGSDVGYLFDHHVLKRDALIERLAKRAGYDDFHGPLSQIAEFYHMKSEFGRSSLVRGLYEIFEQISPKIALYQLLAGIKQPLILVSTAYDTWLEDAFRNAGKRFVSIAPIIRRTPTYDIGYFHLRYSDRDQPESPCSADALMGLGPFEQGYSIIYNIRGCCDAASQEAGQQQDSLTLSEADYFTFARYLDKLVPDYLVTVFTGRGLFFLGFSPTCAWRIPS